MFRIKICGIRNLSDLNSAVQSGADCVGLNFYPPSPRCVGVDFAKEVATASDQIDVAGVFVGESLDSLIAHHEYASLDWIQLHGDEPVEVGKTLVDSSIRVIRAVRLPGTKLSVDQIDDCVRPWLEIGARILLDADGGGQFGGSGQRLDWSGIGRWSETTSAKDWILAGGLTPDNVAIAIEKSRAPAVDVASGTEVVKGCKSPELIQTFVTEALRGFENL